MMEEKLSKTVERIAVNETVTKAAHKRLDAHDDSHEKCEKKHDATDKRFNRNETNYIPAAALAREAHHKVGVMEIVLQELKDGQVFIKEHNATVYKERKEFQAAVMAELQGIKTTNDLQDVAIAREVGRQEAREIATKEKEALAKEVAEKKETMYIRIALVCGTGILGMLIWLSLELVKVKVETHTASAEAIVKELNPDEIEQVVKDKEEE